MPYEIEKQVKPKTGDVWKFPSVKDEFMIMEIGFTQKRLKRMSDGYEYSVSNSSFENNYYFYMTNYDYKNKHA